MNQLAPPIARMGGKSKLRKKLIEMIPKDHTCYVEVFFGVGWVYFGKTPSQVEVINDIDQELINLFKMIKFHPEELERMLQYELSSRDSFSEYKQQLTKHMTEIQRATRFLYLISQSFASKGTTYGYGTTKGPAKHIFVTDNLLSLKERLKTTFIENLSYEKIFNKYDRAHTFFFCDPPYFETDGYAHEFTEEDHVALRDILKNIEGRFLLTINDHPKTREWYKDFNIIETTVPYSVGKTAESRKQYKELIITNYDLEEAAPKEAS